MGKRVSEHYKKWTDEDIQYLLNNWGDVNIKTICKVLGRTMYAVERKAWRLGLPSIRNAGEKITLPELAKALNVDYKTIRLWVDTRGLPVKKKSLYNSRIYIIYLNDFWEWLEKNQDLIDTKKFEENVLGEEPKWLKEKRKKDKMDKFKNKKAENRFWTKEEEELLINLVKQQKYTYNDLAIMFGRTECSISNKIRRLGIADRPLPFSTNKQWKEEEVQRAIELYNQGFTYEHIAKELNKSIKGVRNKIYKYKRKMQENNPTIS